MRELGLKDKGNPKLVDEFEFNLLIFNYTSSFPESIPESSKIRAIIDFTFKESQKLHKRLFVLWIVFLMIPFLLQLLLLDSGAK